MHGLHDYCGACRTPWLHAGALMAARVPHWSHGPLTISCTRTFRAPLLALARSVLPIGRTRPYSGTVITIRAQMYKKHKGIIITIPFSIPYPRPLHPQLLLPLPLPLPLLLPLPLHFKDRYIHSHHYSYRYHYSHWRSGCGQLTSHSRKRHLEPHSNNLQ